ncbi:MAG: hypothetical protein PUI16_08495 [Clostridia bacterium]|nr:hypothetical protein [Clostridia bacterium]MDY5554712.1 hypothetical protein [Blautia sp.]
MDRAQFMEQLKKLLSDISEAERNEALDYYESYFDDAGPENEADVIRELGSPGKVAAIIKADLKENNEDYAQYTEYGYEDTRTKEEGQMPDKYTDHTRQGYHAKKKRNNATIILILILLVFISPFIKGAVGGILGVIITIALLPFLILFALGAGTIVLIIAGVGFFIGGIGLCFTLVPAGMLTIGIGCLFIALALIFAVFLVWLASAVVPKILRKLTDFCSRILHREKKEV